MGLTMKKVAYGLGDFERALNAAGNTFEGMSFRVRLLHIDEFKGIHVEGSWGSTEDNGTDQCGYFENPKNVFERVLKEAAQKFGWVLTFSRVSDSHKWEADFSAEETAVKVTKDDVMQGLAYFNETEDTYMPADEEGTFSDYEFTLTGFQQRDGQMVLTGQHKPYSSGDEDSVEFMEGGIKDLARFFEDRFGWVFSSMGVHGCTWWLKFSPCYSAVEGSLKESSMKKVAFVDVSTDEVVQALRSESNGELILNLEYYEQGDESVSLNGSWDSNYETGMAVTEDVEYDFKQVLEALECRFRWLVSFSQIEEGGQWEANFVYNSGGDDGALAMGSKESSMKKVAFTRNQIENALINTGNALRCYIDIYRQRGEGSLYIGGIYKDGAGDADSDEFELRSMMDGVAHAIDLQLLDCGINRDERWEAEFGLGEVAAEAEYTREASMEKSSSGEVSKDNVNNFFKGYRDVLWCDVLDLVEVEGGCYRFLGEYDVMKNKFSSLKELHKELERLTMEAVYPYDLRPMYFVFSDGNRRWSCELSPLPPIEKAYENESPTEFREGKLSKKSDLNKFGGLTRIGDKVAVDGFMVDVALLKDANFDEEGAELFDLPEVCGPSDKKADLPTQFKVAVEKRGPSSVNETLKDMGETPEVNMNTWTDYHQPNYSVGEGGMRVLDINGEIHTFPINGDLGKLNQAKAFYRAELAKYRKVSGGPIRRLAPLEKDAALKEHTGPNEHGNVWEVTYFPRGGSGAKKVRVRGGSEEFVTRYVEEEKGLGTVTKAVPIKQAALFSGPDYWNKEELNRISESMFGMTYGELTPEKAHEVQHTYASDKGDKGVLSKGAPRVDKD